MRILLSLVISAGFVGTAGYLFRKQCQEKPVLSAIVIVLSVWSVYLALEEASKRVGFPTWFDESKKLPYCHRQKIVDGAISGGTAELEAYIAQCPSGPLTEQIRLALDSRLYVEASACVNSSCTFENCLSIYTTHFPTGNSLNRLEKKIQLRKNSESCKPPEHYCARKRIFATASAGTISDLRNYIHECQPHGLYLAQAKNNLETRLADRSLACIRSSCQFESCLENFTRDFPTGAALANLRKEAAKEARKRRCRISVEAGDAAMMTAVDFLDRGNMKQAAKFVEEALKIWSALSNANEPFIKNKIAAGHSVVGLGLAVMGATKRARAIGCRRLRLARRLYVETGNTPRIAKVEDDMRLGGCRVQR